MAYETNAIGLDLSHHDYTINFPALKKAGLDFVILKAGGCEDKGGEIYDDPRFVERVQQAFDAGFHVIGSYYFASPGYWLKRQYTMPAVEKLTDDNHPILQHFMKLYKNKAVDFVAFDFETASETPQATGIWYRFFLSDIVERIRRQQAKGNLRPFKLGVYSRRTWIDEKSPEMDIWLGTQPDLFIWCANWAKGTMQVKPIAEIVKQRPITGHVPRSFGWCEKRDKTWHVWQWAGDDPKGYGFKCNDAVLAYGNAPRSVDVNLFNGTFEQMLFWLGKTVSVPENPPQNPPQNPPSGDVLELLKNISGKVDEIQRVVKGLEWLVK